VVIPPRLPKQASERDTLVAFLDYYRELLIDKAYSATTWLVPSVRSRHLRL
jgi:hypothetical protein